MALALQTRPKLPWRRLAASRRDPAAEVIAQETRSSKSCSGSSFARIPITVRKIAPPFKPDPPSSLAPDGGSVEGVMDLSNQRKGAGEKGKQSWRRGNRSNLHARNYTQGELHQSAESRTVQRTRREMTLSGTNKDAQRLHASADRGGDTNGHSRREPSEELNSIEQ